MCIYIHVYIHKDIYKYMYTYMYANTSARRTEGKRLETGQSILRSDVDRRPRCKAADVDRRPRCKAAIWGQRRGLGPEG